MSGLRVFVEIFEDPPPVFDRTAVDKGFLGRFRFGVVPGELDSKFPHEVPGPVFRMEPAAELEVFSEDGALLLDRRRPGLLALQQEMGLVEDPGAVSYTHLTLPTILLV